ncbi:Histone-lysine N-methyltransferase SMYD3 [Orchesella cincta]|uniref:Histone-lysine N-methyltransferase SMYD3 n=1 Tax=Orchesella cincta TaxID=48709 RepID=A0A1D2MTZ3_ORCCI|nr:Histone-lysine N-methyltransferase SMYD3 [Orchesella cincta]
MFGHHQKTDWFRHKPDCYPYSIKPVDGKVGLYLVAERWLTADTIIVGEYPLTIFQDYEFKGDGLSKLLEISKSYLYNCPGCSIGKIPIISQGKVHKCSGCGVPLCSPGCETNPEHCEKECKFIKGIGTRETRTSTEIPSILRDITLLRIMQDEKQRRGKLIPFRNPRWGPLLKLTFCKKFKISEVEMEDITASLVTEKTPEYKQLISSLNVKENFPLSFVAIGKSPDGISSELMVALFHWTLEENSMSLEGNGRRALYDKQPFLSHSCAPNCEAWIDDTRFYNKLIVRVIKPIVPGERLTINMVGPLDPTFLLNPTLERRQKLLRFFPVECSCERCIDPTELGTSLAGIRCQICKDSLTCSYYFPTNPLDNKTSWTCSGAKCRATKTAEQILCITLKAQKELRQIALSGQAESVVTKLQDFVIKHQRRILHPGHYLLLIAKSRISKIISTFLGSGYKLFLCVAAEMPRAYDYCSYKLDFVASHLSFLQKIYQGQNEKTCGKLNYEIGFCEVALLFQDLNQDRIAAQTFYKRLHAALETLNKCREMLMPYSDCVVLMEDVKSFSQMIRKLFGTDFLSTYRLKLLDSMEQSFRNVVKEAIVKWTKACDEISLMKYYINPESHAGAEEKDKMSKKDLQNILMEIPEFN